MTLRCVLLSFLPAFLLFAVDQPPSPPAKADSAAQSAPVAKPDDSPAKADSPRSHPHIRFGGLMIGAGYSRSSGGYPYGYGYGPEYWGYSPFYGYNPLLGAAFYHPGYFTGFAYQPSMGNVKIQAPDRTSLVFIDGGLAGRLDKLKDMWLEPGTYNLEVRNSSNRFTQKIYVLSGKTLRVTADMMVNEVLR
jgi:hypothetical protein